jgi:hypothetical protein
MFFRRRKPMPPSFEGQLETARRQGFAVESAGAGRARLSKYGCAAVVEAAGAGQVRFPEAPGIVIDGTIARLQDRGYQKFFLTDRQTWPALAQQLRDLHRFHEEVRRVFGLTSLYNESLGTVSNRYHYDRLEGRE